MRLFTLLEVAAGESGLDFSAFLDALKAAITPQQVLTVLSAVVAIGMTFYLMWLGVRKATGAFTAAVSRGRLKI